MTNRKVTQVKASPVSELLDVLLTYGYIVLVKRNTSIGVGFNIRDFTGDWFNTPLRTRMDNHHFSSVLYQSIPLCLRCYYLIMRSGAPMFP